MPQRAILSGRLVVVFLLVLLACGEPMDRCAAPSRAEIEAMQREMSLPPDITVLRNRWIRASLGWVSQVLDEYPPDTTRSQMRRLALGTLDNPLHLVEAPRIGVIGEFFRHRIDTALEGIEAPAPETGADVWKLYNHGFVVRTANHCYGFDIHPGVDSVSMTPLQMSRLADMLEVLFISHRHGDHASREFVSLMLQRGKPVVTNPDIWSGNPPDGGELTRIEGRSSGRAGGIGYEVFPGHQGDIPNNVYLVKADGVNIMQTGDQHNRADLEGWIGSVGGDWDVDILLPNCWTLDIHAMADGVGPRVVITGHENELGHTVDHRESYGKSYRQLDGLGAPWVLMTWGEKYVYRR